MATSVQKIESSYGDAVFVHGADRPTDFVLVCEHASARIPAHLGDLGVSDAARYSHVAWDIGAADMALALSDQLNAPLALGAISRLVYDCNRPLEAADCIPSQSEAFDVPGNATLTPSQRRARFDAIHQPFHQAVSSLLDHANLRTVFVTIHSFTPIYRGKNRDIEIGYLCDKDERLARSALKEEEQIGRFAVALNEPYSATDGVTHSLRLHGEARGLPYVMIEVRNDLIDTPQTAATMAAHLASVLTAARAEVLG